MKKFLFYFRYLHVMIIYGQQSGKVIYKVRNYNNIEINQKIRTQRVESYYNNILKKHQKIYSLAQDFDFVLKFNPNESLYYWEEEMPDENLNKFTFILARNLGSGMSIKYKSKKDSLLLIQGRKPGLDKLYRETSSLFKYNWKITKETDTILGYSVIKAVSKNIEVWFTPNIPVPFGPAGYGGVPGLMLKKRFIKQFPAYQLVATEIHFYKKPIQIKKPNKGILRTEKEGRTERIKSIKF